MYICFCHLSRVLILRVQLMIFISEEVGFSFSMRCPLLHLKFMLRMCVHFLGLLKSSKESKDENWQIALSRQTRSMYTRAYYDVKYKIL